MSEHHGHPPPPPQRHTTKHGYNFSLAGRRMAVAILLLSTILLTLYRSLGVLGGFQVVPLEHSQGLKDDTLNNRALQVDNDIRVDNKVEYKTKVVPATSTSHANTNVSLPPMTTRFQSALDPITYQEILGLPPPTAAADKDGQLQLQLQTKAPRNKQEDIANKRQQSEWATQQKNRADNFNRTAIVWVCRYLDECGAARVKQLLQTVGAAPANATNSPTDNGRDVWILYNHKSIKASSKEFKLSTKLMAELKTYARTELGIRFRGAQQSSKSLAFDGPRSGAGKSSFLKFVIHAQYGHAWHVEDDVWYTGKWKTLFDTHYEAHDVVATGGPVPPDWYHFMNRKCHIDVPAVAEFNQQRLFLSCNCQNIQQQLTRWAFARVSLRFAESLLELAKGGAVVGHHEAVVASMCHAYHYNCSYDELDSHMGQMVTGGWGDWKNATTQTLKNHGDIQPHKVYHPVKCAAYSKGWKALAEQLASY